MFNLNMHTLKKVLYHSFEVLNKVKIEPIYFVSYLIDLLEYLLLHIFLIIYCSINNKNIIIIQLTQPNLTTFNITLILHPIYILRHDSIVYFLQFYPIYILRHVWLPKSIQFLIMIHNLDLMNTQRRKKLHNFINYFHFYFRCL